MPPSGFTSASQFVALLFITFFSPGMITSLSLLTFIDDLGEGPLTSVNSWQMSLRTNKNPHF